MGRNEVVAALRAAAPADGGEMEYNVFQDRLPPVTQMSLPAHLEQMRVDGTVRLRVEFDGESQTTTLYISVPDGGGA